MKTQNISGLQKPINTGFDFYSTSEEVMTGVSLNGKTAIVTGGYSGIGVETVKQLHKAGATVIVPSRNVDSTRELFKGYTKRLEIFYMDLLQPESIDAFAKHFIESGRPLHFLINNAGIMAAPLRRDARGYESQFATNHLGHYQLTNRLWEALKKSQGARVVTVSSLGHRYSDINYNDPNFEKRPYDKWAAYGQSKTANILFSVHLNELGKSHQIRSFSLHPGRIIETNLKKFMSQEDLESVNAIDTEKSKSVRMKTIEQGAATTLFCVSNPLLDNIGGVYCEDGNIAEINYNKGIDIPKMAKGVLPYAVDKNNAALLWELSHKLTGITI